MELYFPLLQASIVFPRLIPLPIRRLISMASSGASSAAAQPQRTRSSDIAAHRIIKKVLIFIFHCLSG